MKMVGQVLRGQQLVDQEVSALVQGEHISLLWSKFLLPKPQGDPEHPQPLHTFFILHKDRESDYE